MDSPRRRKTTQLKRNGAVTISAETPEWLENVRVSVQAEAPIMQTLMVRAINAVLKFSSLSEKAVMEATRAPTDLDVLLKALASDGVLEDLAAVEPLAPAFIRGIEAKRRIIEENGGTLSSEAVGTVLNISRQAVEKRRRMGKLLAFVMGRHGYRYPAWQFTESGVLSGFEDVLAALASHDEWMQAAFFLGHNPRLGGRTPVQVLKAGKVSSVLNAAAAYGEHGAA